MEIRRIKNPQIIEILSPFFTEDGAFNRSVIVKEITNVMISTPDEIFVVILFEKNKIKGFGIAWVQDDREYVWLAQVYFDPEYNRDYGKQALNMIKQWAANEHNIHKIRFETDRNPKVIERVWGFKFHATVMECEF